MGSIPVLGPILNFAGWLVCKAATIVATLPPETIQGGLGAFKAVLGSVGIKCD